MGTEKTNQLKIVLVEQGKMGNGWPNPWKGTR